MYVDMPDLSFPCATGTRKSSPKSKRASSMALRGPRCRWQCFAKKECVDPEEPGAKCHALAYGTGLNNFQSYGPIFLI